MGVSNIPPASGICVLEVDRASRAITWSGDTGSLERLLGDSLPSSLDLLCAALAEESGNRLRNHISGSGDAEDSSWELVTKQSKGPLGLVTGAVTSSDSISYYLHIIDQSKLLALPSTRKIKAALELEAAEAHHRIKNTLQNVISYIHIMFTQKDSVAKGEIGKLVQYIHSLTSLHDVLFDEVKKGGSTKIIHVDRIITHLVELHSLSSKVSCEEFPPMLGTPRRAATLSLVLNELLSFSASLSLPLVSLRVADATDTMATLILAMNCQDGVTPHQLIEQFPSGVKVVESIAKADFQYPIEWHTEGGVLTAIIKFPLEAAV